MFWNVKGNKEIDTAHLKVTFGWLLFYDYHH